MLKRSYGVAAGKRRPGRIGSGRVGFVGVFILDALPGRTPGVLIETLLAEPLLNTLEFVVCATPFYYPVVTVETVRIIHFFGNLSDFGSGRIATYFSSDCGNFGNAFLIFRIIRALIRVMASSHFSGRFLAIDRWNFTCNNWKHNIWYSSEELWNRESTNMCVTNFPLNKFKLPVTWNYQTTVPPVLSDIQYNKRHQERKQNEIPSVRNY